jgi:hypothetical protein
MRRLHWQKTLPAYTASAASQVVWLRMKKEVPAAWDDGLQDELAGMLEANFSDLPKPRGKQRHSAPAASHAHTHAPKQAVKRLLEVKRSNGIAILLSQLPEIEQLVAAIWALDDSVLPRDLLEALIKQLPTREEEVELSKFRNFSENRSVLFPSALATTYI